MTPADEAHVEARIRAAIARLQAEEAHASAERWRTLYLVVVGLGAGLGLGATIGAAAEALQTGACL